MDGKILGEPLLDVNVANYVERGLLGIALGDVNVTTSDKDSETVFLYFTESLFQMLFFKDKGFA